MGDKRYHPPSEDFSEAKAKLKWANLRIEELLAQRVRQSRIITDLRDELADVLDDVGGKPHTT